MRNTLGTKIRAAAALAALALALAPGGAKAQLLINGDFSLPGTSGQLTVNTTLTGWTGIGKEGNYGSQTTPPVFVFAPGSTTQLTTTGVNGDAFMGNVKFWSAIGFPGGGNIVAADGDPDWAGGITQTVTGLTVGDTYILRFNWAGVQQQGFYGATTEKWQVSFGSDTQSTATVATPSQGFLGWQSATMSFTATSTNQLLTFLAVGTPGGQPPWLLLNGVQLNNLASVPEPNTMLLGAVVVALGVGLHRRNRRKAA